MLGAVCGMTHSIRSFLVHVRPGQRADVTARVAALPGCHVQAAENRDVLVVVAVSADREEADGFDEALSSTAGVEGVALIAGFTEEVA